MKKFCTILLISMCCYGISWATVEQQNETASTVENKTLQLQLNLMKGLAEKFKQQFSFASSQKVYNDMNNIISKLDIYDAKAQMYLLENLGGLIVSQNENIKNLVKFVSDLVTKMNVNEVDGQKSLLKNLHNMVDSLSGDENIQNLKGLFEKATTSYDKLVQTHLEKTRNSYLNSNLNTLPPSKTLEELSNMITVHGSFNTNNDVISVLRQLVEPGHVDEENVKLEIEEEHRGKIDETFENAKTLFNEMVEKKLNEIKRMSSNKQQHSTLKDLSDVISKMENLEQPTQISLIETLFTLVQRENSSLNTYNRQFKEANTSYNKSVEEKLGYLILRYFTSSDAGYKKYTPPDDMILKHIESLISKNNEPKVNDTILAILHQLNDLPQDKTLREELIRKVETLNNDVAMVQLKEISKQYAENSKNVDDSVFQKLDQMIADITYFDETTKRSFVGVLHQLAHVGKEDVKRSKQLIRKAATFINEWITTHLNEIRDKYLKTQTAIHPDDELFHQLDILMSPHNELGTSQAIVSMIKSMTSLAKETRLVRDKLLEKAENYYNISANQKLDELLEKHSKELPHAIPSNDEIFDEMDSLISDVNHINLNGRILDVLDKIETNCENDEAQARHDRLMDKLISIVNRWSSNEIDRIEKNFRERKQSSLLLPSDPIFDQLDRMITEVIWPGISQQVTNVLLIMKALCRNEEAITKCTLIMGKNRFFFNKAVKRDVKKIIRKIKKLPNIHPEDPIFEDLDDISKGIINFFPDTIEQIFLALKDLTSMYPESLKKRDDILQHMNDNYKVYVDDRLTRHGQNYGNKDFLESINEVIFDTNDLETNVTILKFLLEMECEEEEDQKIQNTLIQKVKMLEHRWVESRLGPVVHNYLDNNSSEKTSSEGAEINEVDELVSNLKYMLPETQEHIVVVLLEIMNTRSSNRDGFIRKWYDNCTIPELKQKYRKLIELQLSDTGSPLEVNNPGSENVDSPHQVPNNHLQEVESPPEEHNFNYSQSTNSPRRT